MSMNTAILMGRFTDNPELKNTSNGTTVTNFTIAVDRKYQPAGGEKKTDFLNCIAWRSTAEFICKYFRKGQMVAIVGEIQTDTYTDKDGNNRKKFEILVDEAHFCGAKSENQGTEAAAVAPSPATAFTQASGQSMSFADVAKDDDLPF